MTWNSITASAEFIRTKRVRALGIGSTKRSPLIPDVPTISEAGLPGYELGSWYGMFAPARTPQAIVRRLHHEIVKALAAPEIKEQLLALSAEGVGSTPEEFRAVLRKDLAKWAKVARAANVKVQ